MPDRELADHDARLKQVEREIVTLRDSRHKHDNLIQGAVSASENALLATEKHGEQVKRLMSNMIDQHARERLIKLEAAHKAHELICERIERENRDWRIGTRGLIEDLRTTVKEFIEGIGDRFGAQQAINSDIYLKIGAPDKLILKLMIGMNGALVAAVVYLFLKLVHVA